ncbi:hypothetical protein ALP05_03098 [Pseudomonas caricapapayae]|uniref:YD repeat-containing protein n=1 Tax=Pseudomonas caricapapayae TaxID=46678 RepID=A0A3M6EUF0_9PSED|nr:hypothetical protein [Pseudomonas caricapapayae]RMV71971.1 hypothetical protein ALP05_03098 [Pseudomonas caricapapayae]
MSTQEIHSQASNFLGFVKTGVDPRTGQFTLAMSLPLAPANHLAGPSLTPTLAFSPLGSTQNRGFGLGWSLNLSELNLNPDAPMLRLVTGEQFAVDWANSDLNIGGELAFLDYKLRAMRVIRTAENTFRVDLKSGNSEILTRQDSGNYLLSEMRSPEGRRLFIDWMPFGESQCIVDTIRDENGTLMQVVSKNGEVHFISHPDSDHTCTALRLMLSNDQLNEVYLPEIDRAFSFSYRAQPVAPGAELLFPVEVSGPLGAVDIVHWATGENGHQLPEAAPFRHLPRVATWTHSAGGAGELHRAYQWIGDHNFLGFGSDQGFDWKHGEDNLYQVERDYEYELIETQHDSDNQLLATITRTWNRFHLLTLETSLKGDCEVQIETLYGIDPALTWEQQPAWCQLPHNTITTYIDHAHDNARRSEQTEYRYDEYGNVTHTRYATGVQEHSEYYPAQGAEGCPADALGMVRYLKSKTIVPAPVHQNTANQASVISIAYTYEALESLLEDGLSQSIVVSEQARDVTRDRLLETTRQHYVSARNACYGSLASSVNTLNGLDTITTYRYEIDGDQRVTYVSVEGFEKNEQNRSVSSSCQSLITGLTTLEQSESGVRTCYEYDLLGRINRKIVAQGSDFEAVTTAAYHVGDAVALTFRADEAINPVMVEQTDVTGQRKRNWLDGEGRVVCIELDDIDQAPGTFRKIAHTVYDALGRPVLQSAQDWLPGSETPLKSTTAIRYDDWGSVSCIETADGVVAHTRHDPVSLRTEQWQQSAQQRSPRSVTLSNIATTPVEQQLYDQNDHLVRTTVLIRDGLDRVIEERVKVHGQADIVTGSRFDAYSRVIERHLPDGTIINWTFAPHSDGHHPETVIVTPATEASA